MIAADLDGCRVLLLMIGPVHDETGFVSGVAAWTGSKLIVTIPGVAGAVPVRALDVERAGFPPGRLRQLIATKSVEHLAEEYAAGASWCVPIFVRELPATAEVLTCIFAGMARGRDGEVLIFPPDQPEVDSAT